MKVSRQPAAGATTSATASAMRAPTAYREKMTPPAPIGPALVRPGLHGVGHADRQLARAAQTGEEAQAGEQTGAAGHAGGGRGQAVEGDRGAERVLAAEAVGGVAERERPQRVARQHDRADHPLRGGGEGEAHRDQRQHERVDVHDVGVEQESEPGRDGDEPGLAHVRGLGRGGRRAAPARGRAKGARARDVGHRVSLVL